MGRLRGQSPVEHPAIEEEGEKVGVGPGVVCQEGVDIWFLRTQFLMQGLGFINVPKQIHLIIAQPIGIPRGQHCRHASGMYLVGEGE
eukprot:1214375-Pyramimonas_sp.AAC.1